MGYEKPREVVSKKRLLHIDLKLSFDFSVEFINVACILRIGVDKKIEVIAKAVVQIESSESGSSGQVKWKVECLPPAKKPILQLV